MIPTLEPLRDCLRENVPLAPLTTFKLGGPADYLFEPDSLEKLQKGLTRFAKAGIPVTVLGDGSNVLVHDDGYRGAVLRLVHSAFRQQSTAGAVMCFGAGVKNNQAALYAEKQGLSGLEFLCGFPGTLGGSVAGNAGSPEHWIGQHLVRLEGFTAGGDPRVFEVGSLEHAYRSLPAVQGHILHTVHLSGVPEQRALIRQTLQLIRERRKQNDPKGYTAGSVFVNPFPDRAWEIIDRLGLRGRNCGGAAFSEKHANWIVHQGHARAADVYELIRTARRLARDELGLTLRVEIRLLGDFHEMEK